MPNTRAELDATMQVMSRIWQARNARMRGNILKHPWKDVVDQFNLIQDVPERLKWLDIMAKRPEGAHLRPRQPAPPMHPVPFPQPVNPIPPLPGRRALPPNVPPRPPVRPREELDQPRQESYISSFDRLAELVMEQKKTPPRRGHD